MIEAFLLLFFRLFKIRRKCRRFASYSYGFIVHRNFLAVIAAQIRDAKRQRAFRAVKRLRRSLLIIGNLRFRRRENQQRDNRQINDGAENHDGNQG